MFPFRVRILIVGTFISLILFLATSWVVVGDLQSDKIRTSAFDQTTAEAVIGLRAPLFTNALSDITALGSLSVIIFLLALVVSVSIFHGKRKGLIFIAVVCIGGKLLPALLKLFFNRVRPSESEWLVSTLSDLSFPSGHSFGAAAAYLGFAYYASLYAKTRALEIFYYLIAILLIATIGFSRIYLGVHFPTDVLAGITGGAAWSLGAAVVYELHSLPLRK